MKFLHMTIQTDKFEDEVRFYEEQVGLKVQKDMRPMGRNMVFLADAENDTEIEIIENPDAKDAGNANVSIGFQTEDVEAKRKQMDEAGFKVSPMVSPMSGVKFFFVTDPAGVSVQFM